MEHKPVLLQEVLDGLSVKPDGIYIDATFGRGGHSRAILAGLGPKGRLLALDQDSTAIAAAIDQFSQDGRFTIERGSFAMLDTVTKAHGIQGQVDGLLLDIGVSSPQLDNAERGFSFSHDGPLDMRMDTDTGISAADWLATVGEKELIHVLKAYGEERFARRITAGIFAAREQTPITRTTQLADIIVAAVPRREPGKHPATRSFQAIRIAINDELGALEAVLDQTIDILKPGGRLAVVCFHSLEDRIVKRFIRDAVRGDEYPPGVPIKAQELNQRLRYVGKMITPSLREITENPRARSAKLRIAEKLT